MSFPFYAQVFVMYVPKSLACPFAETEITNVIVLAPTDGQMECAIGEMHEGNAAGGLVELLEQEARPAGVYSIMAPMRWSGGKSEDTPSGPGEYWSEASPTGAVLITRLEQEDGIGLLSDMEVDDELTALLFPNQKPITLGDIRLG